MIVILAVILGCVGWVAYLVWFRESPSANTSDSPVSSETQPVADPSSEAAEIDTSWVLPLQDEYVELLAPGLYRCASRVDGVALESLYGIGVRFPHTLEGAVAHSAELLRHRYGRTWVVDAQRDPIQQVMVSSPASKETAARAQAAASVNGLGESLDFETGEVTPGVKYWAEAYPKYGAYRVLSTTYSDGELRQVLIDWWIPTAYGNGDLQSPPAEPFTMWIHATFAVTWNATSDTWRTGSNSLETVPTPPGGAVNQSFTARASALAGTSSPWCVSSDATSEHLAGVFGDR
jgi:hypothetical protein